MILSAKNDYQTKKLRLCQIITLPTSALRHNSVNCKKLMHTPDIKNW